MGSISIGPPPDQSGEYAPGSVVVLTANPAPGCAFSGWSGNSASTNNPLALTMNSDKTLTADFQAPPPSLAVYQPQTAESLGASGFRLLLSGLTNISYAIEYTTNFTAWTAFQTSLVASDNQPVRDAAASNSPVRFYRARLLP